MVSEKKKEPYLLERLSYNNKERKGNIIVT
jgi:hypothetical protein